MKQIKLFENVNKNNLEREVNQFVRELDPSEEVVDIRYNNYMKDNHYAYWTAMIIYDV